MQEPSLGFVCSTSSSGGRIALASDRASYLAGGLYGGTIRWGMVAHVPGEGGRIHMIPIIAVEFVDGPGKRSDVALQVVAENPEQQAAIETLHANRVIEIAEPLG
jgi:hypothetical protein